MTVFLPEPLLAPLIFALCSSHLTIPLSRGLRGPFSNTVLKHRISIQWTHPGHLELHKAVPPGSKLSRLIIGYCLRNAATQGGDHNSNQNSIHCPARFGFEVTPS